MLEDENIQVGVQDPNGQVTQFKIKMNTPLRKLMTSYCTRKNIGMDAVRFCLDGVRLQGHKCPGDYDMQQGDTLEVFQEQQGGDSEAIEEDTSDEHVNNSQ